MVAIGFAHRTWVALAVVALAAAVIAANAFFGVSHGTTRPVAAAVPGVNGKIAFVRGSDSAAEIFTMNPDGSDQTQLTNNAAADTFPAWSPDGTKIAFSSNNDIYVMNGDGTGVAQLTSTTAVESQPAWSPDGTSIAYVKGTSPSQIFVMNADGTNPVQLTTDSNASLLPAYSPDGGVIAFVRDFFSTTQIYVMNADGTGQTSLTSGLGGRYSLDWAPDRTKIAFQETVGDMDVVVMNADGTGATNITNTPFWEGDPSWSPDGTKIAFYHEGSIATMNSDGSSVTDLTAGYNPSWQRVPGSAITATPCPTDGCPTNTPANTPTWTPTPTPSPTPCGPYGCPGVDFSIGSGLLSGAGGACDGSGSPTNVCDVPLGAKFNVNVYLHSLPAIGGYDAFQFYLSYAGVSATETKQAVHPNYWPDCALIGLSFTPGTVQAGCAIGIGALSSTYTGRMAAPEFTCTASGTITLVHGDDYTSIFDNAYNQFSEGSDESLAINCVAPQAYPGDTDGDGCPDAPEAGMNQMMGGRRNFLNPWDWWDPTGDQLDRIADVLAVTAHYGKNAGGPGYDAKYDRTYLGPNPWNLGPPNGQIRIDDVLMALRQYGAGCSAS